MLCKSLGILATAHADGKLFLRLLPRLQAGEGPTVTAGEPLQTLTKDPTALIQVCCNTHVCALGHFWHLYCLGTSDIQHPISKLSSLECQDLSRTYLARHELESVIIIIIINWCMADIACLQHVIAT